MSKTNKILKLGLKEAECFNCLKNLNIKEEINDELEVFGKVYYRCTHCEYFSKIYTIGGSRTVIREA